jgi:uncharacterized protein (TIGR02145 family)
MFYRVRAEPSKPASWGRTPERTYNRKGNKMKINQLFGSHPSLTDIDGNTYRTVKIGNQLWMAENLKTTHYRNGDPIPNVTDHSPWDGLTTGAYCYYDNNAEKAQPYGLLYNWYAVNDHRNIAPVGWHVASDAEWKILVDYLGGDADAGDKMKEKGTAHWQSPNTGATNRSGFSALPGGCRMGYGYFGNLGESALFWSSSEGTGGHAWAPGIGSNRSRVARNDCPMKSGLSVRCVRD